jgi:uncharacterized NAD-dependent epimerase/dehydratase family protein
MFDESIAGAMRRPTRRAVILCGGSLGTPLAKTAHGLVLHARKHTVVGVVDARSSGRDAGDVIVGRKTGIPVFADFEAAVRATRPDVVIVGVATVGGVLPDGMREDLLDAAKRGIDIVSGMHTFLSEDLEFARAIEASGATIWDVRKPPADLRVFDGRVRHVAIPRLLVAGTDCDVGKRLAALEIIAELETMGLRVGFVATGQTGCMIGPDAGAVIDRIPGDFMSGQVERMICEVAEGMAPDIIVLYGQASINHPAYSGVAIACVHGSAPNAIVLAHDPVRKERVFFDSTPLPPVSQEIKQLEELSGAPVIAVAVNGSHSTDPVAASRGMEAATGRLARDVVRQGAKDIAHTAVQALGLRLSIAS